MGAARAQEPDEGAVPGVEFRGIAIDRDRRAVTFPAAVNQREGMLEYLLVAETGKVHESLLSTKVRPYDIQVAMLLLGVKPAATASSEPPGQINRAYLKNAPELRGESVEVWLAWKDAAGPHRARAEDWIWNKAAGAVMTEGPWVYNGSEMYEGRFLAQVDGSIAALVRDSAALVNNPRPGNDDDQIWKANTDAVPALGTAVDVTLELGESGK